MKTSKNTLNSKIASLFLLFCLLDFHSAESQTLQNYIEEAQSNNPKISSFELRYKISSEKAEETNTFPDTELAAGYFVSEPETRTGPQKAKLSVKQMFPWFGTITAREKYASSLSETDLVELTIAKKKLAMAVAQSYYRLYALKEKEDILAKNIELLNTYERMALTSVEIGKASAVSVLRLQIRQNELVQKKLVLQQDYLAENVTFNKLLNRDEISDITLIDTLTIPSEEMIEDFSSLQIHPELLKYDKLYESISQSEHLNLKEAAPMFGLGLDYIAVAERPDMNFSDNGKDILMPMVSISIPIFNNKYKSVSRQNTLKQEELLAQKQDRQNNLMTQLQTAVRNRNAARISYETQLKNLGQAKNAEEILIKSYETGTIDFNDVLDVQELQLKFETELIDSIKMYFEQATIINYFIN
ncbi:MAG: TolC family protein [Aequorivita sp.]|nr:TolC family protein [Aequorivita sp.]